MALAFTVCLLRLAQQPILDYLDVLVTGMLIYQSFGRFGCFMAGCCHGKPHGWGVRYGQAYQATRYPYFVGGVRLFPLQLIEALWLCVLTSTTLYMTLAGYAPGEGLTCYVVGYGVGRFYLELLRGDTGRIYLRGLFEPQWTAALLCLVTAGFEWVGILVFHWTHTMVAAIILLSVAFLLFRGRSSRLTAHQVLQPDHILEVFYTINWINWINHHANIWGTMAWHSTGLGPSITAVTSKGIHISGAPLTNLGPRSYQYQVSSARDPMRKGAALAIAKLIVRLRDPQVAWKLWDNGNGIHQLLVGQ
jgi:hypothetical protein